LRAYPIFFALHFCKKYCLIRHSILFIALERDGRVLWRNPGFHPMKSGWSLAECECSQVRQQDSPKGPPFWLQTFRWWI
jgi:hypothetical protein